MAQNIWRTVRNEEDEDVFVFCGQIDDSGNLSEYCSAYCDGELCKTCRYATGKVIEEEREEE